MSHTNVEHLMTVDKTPEISTVVATKLAKFEMEVLMTAIMMRIKEEKNLLLNDGNLIGASALDDLMVKLGQP